MKFPNSTQTVVTLANASELVCRIAEKVIGSDVADSVGGTSLNDETLQPLAQARFQMNLSTYRGKVNA
jgi:hypothetical protein